MLDEFRDTIRKHLDFYEKINITSDICKELRQLCSLRNIAIGAILIDKLKLYNEFTEFYFDKELRMKQINEAIEFQKND